MSPKTVAAYVDISRTLMNQSDPSVEAILRADLAAGVAGAIDTVALNGGGTNEPSGILQTSGIGSVTLGSAGNPTFGEIVDIETQVSQDNALTGALSYITTPAVLGAMKQKAKDSGSGIFVADGMSANGHPVYTTSNCSANTILFGNFSDLVIGQFGAIEVVTQRSATSGALTLGIFSDVDVAVRHAESFAKGA
jgi:HK97 family phage major capsid protein